MTASSLSPLGFRAPARRRQPWRAWRVLAIFALLLAVLPLVLGGRALAEEPVKGEIKVFTDDGYARLVFRFDKEVPATVNVSFPVMVVTFKKPVAIAVDRLRSDAPDYISAARIDPDGSAIRIALVHKVKVNSIPAAERLYVDLLPENWSGIMPGLPSDVIEQLANRALGAERRLQKQRVTAKLQTPATIRVKVATQATFTRYVFSMPDLTNVLPERAEGKLTLDFDQPIKWDLSDAQAAMPRTLKSIKADVDDDSVAVTFELNGTPQVRTFREDRSIVVDVGHDGGKAKLAAAAPVIGAPETMPAAGAAARGQAPKSNGSRRPGEAAAPPSQAKSATAEPIRPAPNPNAPVIAMVHRVGDDLRAEFPFAVETPAAIFQRADTLWLVFDSAAKINLTALTTETSWAIRSATLDHGADGEAIVRIKLVRPRLVSLDADGPGWIVTIGGTATKASRPLGIVRNVVGNNRGSLTIPFENPRKLHVLADRDIGDRLLVITGLGPARGFLKGQNFVELRALPSTQGVVLQLLADDVTAELAIDKISVTRPGGLSLSPTALNQRQELASKFRTASFDTQVWGFDSQAKFNVRQSELVRTAAMSSMVRRKQARFNLARFYFARGMAAEAKAVLDVALADRKGDDDITGTVLKAVADVLLERPAEALKQLSNPLVGNHLDAPIWRAVAYARESKWQEAQAIFKTVENAMAGLPIELQRVALRAALRTAIEMRDFNGADRILNELDMAGVPSEMAPALAVLTGRLNEALGRNEEALSNYRIAATSQDRLSAAQGRLREIELRYAIGEMSRKDVINALELLTTIWRGDETEAEGLKLLAHLYTEESRYREALHVMRTALLVHPNSELTRQIQDEAAVTFDSLFIGGKADALAPIEALGMFYDFRDLTPVGRRGDEMIRRLADRLVSVDLLDQAAELLQHQVDHRLQGGARAQVATRLAVIYLMNHKPERALTTLRATRTSELSNELRDQRLLLEARALSDTGRHDLALELIANIDNHESTRLRSDILWAARRWRAAAEQIEILYGLRWREFTPLNDAERFDVLRAAVGYSLGDDPIGLARFREKYAAKMADTPDRRAFDIVTAPVGNSGAEFVDVAKRVASVDSLDAFLRDMRKRYPDSAAISAATTANEAAPPPAGATKAVVPGKDATNAPGKSDAAASPLPPKGPAATPAKPDRTPTGSISGRPRASVR